MSIRTNEELDPNEGPSFTEFAVLASLFAIILLLIPVGVFTFSWPVWLLGLLLFIDLGLLFLVGNLGWMGWFSWVLAVLCTGLE